jgi:hypothetical protein
MYYGINSHLITAYFTILAPVCSPYNGQEYFDIDVGDNSDVTGYLDISRRIEEISTLILEMETNISYTQRWDKQLYLTNNSIIYKPHIYFLNSL